MPRRVRDRLAEAPRRVSASRESTAGNGGGLHSEECEPPSHLSPLGDSDGHFALKWKVYCNGGRDNAIPACPLWSPAREILRFPLAPFGPQPRTRFRVLQQVSEGLNSWSRLLDHEFYPPETCCRTRKLARKLRGVGRCPRGESAVARAGSRPLPARGVFRLCIATFSVKQPFQCDPTSFRMSSGPLRTSSGRNVALA